MKPDTRRGPAAPAPGATVSRRHLIGCASLLVSLAACGGGGGGSSAAPTPPVAGGTPPAPTPPAPPAPTPPAPPAPTPPAPPAPTPPAPPAPTPPPTGGGVGPNLLVARSVNAGTGPYSATVFPLPGQVPAGSTLASPDDPSMRAAVLSRWPDNSASVVVASGVLSMGANESRNLRLETRAAPAGETNLGAARVAATLASVVLDCGGVGRAQVSNFANPERIWWATPQNVCARYRAPVVGHDTLELVLDVHAYADGRAFVEAVVENCRLNAAAATPTRPPSASYAGATLSINGSNVATVAASGAPEGTHVAFRAWYASAWVGGDPTLRVTPSPGDLQQHPLLFKCVRDNGADLAVYAGDSYSPWNAGRHRATNMGGAGDHPSIGPLTLWDTRALQSGDSRAWRAAEANALAVLGFAVNYRDSSTGLVPTFAQIGTKAWLNGAGPWPMQAYNGSLGWEVAHHPATGLMAFAARPSPVFIELAQKVAVTNGTWSSNATPNFTAGVHGFWYQVRGRAWCLRSLAHAAFLTPDADAWKTAARTALAANVAYLDTWRTDGKFVLGAMCDQSPGSPLDHEAGMAGFFQSIWQHRYMATEIHKVARAGLLAGSQQAALDMLADWCCLEPVRFVNEQTNGGWRYIPYKDKLGDSDSAIGSRATWGSERNRSGNHGDGTSGASGTWMSSGGSPTTYAAYTADNGAGAYYPSYFWAALAAARERNLTGADQAWRTVQSNITNLSSWLNGFAADPRWGATPRNV